MDVDMNEADALEALSGILERLTEKLDGFSHRDELWVVKLSEKGHNEYLNVGIERVVHNLKYGTTVISRIG